MMKPLTGTKVAVLMANGFDEESFIAVQKKMQELGATIHVISTNQGLVNGWDGSGWGHNYAVDAQLNTALGVDYAALIIPGGQRSLEKLMLTAHTRRFVGSFMSANKPVVVMDDALKVMVYAMQLAEKTVAGDEKVRAESETAGACWSSESFYVDGALLTGRCCGENSDDYFAAMEDVFMEHVEMEKENISEAA